MAIVQAMRSRALAFPWPVEPILGRRSIFSQERGCKHSLSPQITIAYNEKPQPREEKLHIGTGDWLTCLFHLIEAASQGAGPGGRRNLELSDPSNGANVAESGLPSAIFLLWLCETGISQHHHVERSESRSASYEEEHVHRHRAV